ncbi:uncharacterized protein LOC107646303 [Arachis ipaensis]|uniref:uncharacterized protein LOC107646303 n=1 Tax=Arachis ipaensis TaxID=130454 RepID=UPI000A2B916F|nr:uncharacterized protein LOC107646303 [Arachis ipaensis]XP_025660982.1 uncharacterized protein LOC112756578 [Arachis hypogaea]
MKTPPNSEDELEEVDSDEVFPVFRGGGRFGELKLEVGMKFNSKMEFKEAVCEYYIQERRQIWWKKNDNLRMRAMCKGEGCGWLVYASRDSEAAQYFKSKCDLDLNKSSLTRALRAARAVVYADAAAQYGMVRDYGLTLLKTNPSSTISIGVRPHPNLDEDPTFDRMYICLDGCKRGFKASCRPLIGLDGAFLKTQHGGQILSTTGQDANNHIYVIAYAIVFIKNIENWQWFLELLHQDLGDYKQHGWCFISDMQKVLSMQFRMCFQMFITYSVYDIYGGISTNSGRIISLEVCFRSVKDYEIFEVHRWPTNMAVDLGKRSCTCDFWQLSGMSCVHAYAALARTGKKSDESCHHWLTMEAYNNTYTFHINPIPGQTLWEKSPHNRLQAPKFKKKKRRKDADEEPSRGKKQNNSMKRVYKKGHCRYCGETGHTKRNCCKRAVDEESAAVAAAATADTDANGGEDNNSALTAAVNGGDAPPMPQDQVEIQLDLNQPVLSETDDSQQVQPPFVRPTKLPSKRKLSTPEKNTPSTSTPAATT